MASASCLCIRCVDTHKRSPVSFPLPHTRRCSTCPTLSRTNRAGVHISRLSQKPFSFLPTSDQERMSKSKCYFPEKSVSVKKRTHCDIGRFRRSRRWQSVVYRDKSCHFSADGGRRILWLPGWREPCGLTSSESEQL